MRERTSISATQSGAAGPTPQHPGHKVRVIVKKLYKRDSRETTATTLHCCRWRPRARRPPRLAASVSSLARWRTWGCASRQRPRTRWMSHGPLRSCSTSRGRPTPQTSPDADHRRRSRRCADRRSTCSGGPRRAARSRTNQPPVPQRPQLEGIVPSGIAVGRQSRRQQSPTKTRTDRPGMCTPRTLLPRFAHRDAPIGQPDDDVVAVPALADEPMVQELRRRRPEQRASQAPGRTSQCAWNRASGSPGPRRADRFAGSLSRQAATIR